MSEINRIKNDTQGKYNGNETEYILQVLVYIIQIVNY